LTLLRLASPGLPIGSFAYSQGLEAAVDAHWVTDEASLLVWVQGLLEGGLGRLDLPALMHAHALFAAEAPPSASQAVAARVFAMRGAAELQAEDRRLGQALARVLEGWGVIEAQAWSNARHACYPVVFALGAAHGGASAELSALAFAFAWAEAQVAAALRLLPVGQSAGQRILSAVASSLPGIVAAAVPLAPDPEAWMPRALAPAYLSGRHETQYSRLFRS